MCVGRGVAAPDGASQAFCRRQNLDAGRIYFARADERKGAPGDGVSRSWGVESNACGFQKGDRGMILL